MNFDTYRDQYPEATYADFVAYVDSLNKAADWLTLDLPAMRKRVRVEFPDWTPGQVAIEAIRRLDARS